MQINMRALESEGCCLFFKYLQADSYILADIYNIIDNILPIHGNISEY